MRASRVARSTEAVTYQVADGVALITLSRPERLNALTDEMMDDLLPDACRRADADPDVRVIVLTGEGGNFCAGGDLEQRVTAVRERLRATLEHDHPDLGRFVLPLLAVEKPTIAALEGVVAGGGLALALACDLRTARSDVRICSPFILRGLVPDGGATAALVAAVGYAAAIDMALTGRVIEGEEALRLGLIQRLWTGGPGPAKTLELARQIATLPRQATRLTKRALAADRYEAVRSALVTESWFQSICMRDPDFDEGVAAFLEKRPPQFRP